MVNNEDEHLETYGEPNIASYDAPVPKWLKVVYIVLPIWGIISFCIFWNGSRGWFDRGYWNELQKAALTTYPNENLYSEVDKSK